MKRLFALLKRPGIRYLLVGGSIFVLELLVIVICQHAGLAAVPAVGVGYVVGTLAGFTLQKFVTFGDTRTHFKIVGWQLAATVGLVVVNLLFSLAVAATLQHTWPAVVNRTLAIMVTTIWNFYLYKTHIFAGAPEPMG